MSAAGLDDLEEAKSRVDRVQTCLETISRLPRHLVSRQEAGGWAEAKCLFWTIGWMVVFFVAQGSLVHPSVCLQSPALPSGDFAQLLFWVPVARCFLCSLLRGLQLSEALFSKPVFQVLIVTPGTQKRSYYLLV